MKIKMQSAFFTNLFFLWGANTSFIILRHLRDMVEQTYTPLSVNAISTLTLSGFLGITGSISLFFYLYKKRRTTAFSWSNFTWTDSFIMLFAFQLLMYAVTTLQLLLNSPQFDAITK